MINLLLDIIISSVSSYNSSFIIFDLVKKHSIIYIIIVSLIISYYTLNIYYFFIGIIIYYLRYFIKYDYLLYALGYILLFNIHININSTIIFIILVLFNYSNPYN